MMYDGWMWGNGWGWAGWVLMSIVMVLFWAAVITAIVLAIRYAGGSRDTASGPPSYGRRVQRTCSPNASPAARSMTTSTGSVSRCCANTADHDG